MDALADLSLRLADMSEGTFPHLTVHYIKLCMNSKDPKQGVLLQSNHSLLCEYIL